LFLALDSAYDRKYGIFVSLKLMCENKVMKTIKTCKKKGKKDNKE
jgi:hypothetical protein